MSREPPGIPVHAVPGAEMVAAELDRICESSAFRHSLRHQQFLRHLIERKLARDHAGLREMALGIGFFRRNPSTYDPKEDAVVRVEAARLRQRLEKYYGGEGVTAPLEISLDRGSYTPVIRYRAPVAVDLGRRSSVAVIPLCPAGEELHDQEQAANLSDEIVRTLQRVPQLRVIGPHSAVALASETPGAASVPVQVDWLIRGRWTSASPRCLVLELANGATDANTAEIVITNAVGLKLHQRVREEVLYRFMPLMDAGTAASAAADRQRKPAALTGNLTAFELYQRARAALRHRTASVLNRAIALLEEAVTEDPAFGAAWSQLAEAYFRRQQILFNVGGRDAQPALNAATRAIELDPDAGLAYSILARLAYVNDFDWARAEELFGKAVDAAPRESSVRSAYASFLMHCARFEESLREYDVIRALDPLDPSVRCDLGALNYHWGRLDRAETLLTQVLEIDPHDTYAGLLLADTYAQAHQPQASLAMSERLIASAPDYASSWIYKTRALLLLGERTQAEQLQSDIQHRFADRLITGYEHAMLHIAAGEPADALRYLETLVAERGARAHCLAVDPTFMTLWDDPRWSVLLARIGLPGIRSQLATMLGPAVTHR